MIEISKLKKNYGNLNALKGIDMSINFKEIYGFIGPNGAGKSTTLRILSTLTRDYEGEVVIDNMHLDINNRYELRKQIGFMPDVVGIYRHIFVWEYLDFFCRAYEVPPSKRNKIIDDCLALVDLSEKKNSLVGHLSRGMTQRLLLAKTLVHNPKILLLDEPASGLDPRARIELLMLLKELKSMGKTILISSHILSEMEGLCDRFGIIEAGEMVFEGSLDDIQIKLRSGNYISLSFYRELSKPENEAILEIEDVIEMKGEGKDYTILCNDGDESIKKIMKHLIMSDFPIISFSPRKYNLDEVFMKITKGKVQ